MTLATFQQAFWQGLWSADGSGAPPGCAEQPGYAVYRNTVQKACVDSLLSLYPAVRRLVGDDCLRAWALAFARAHPPDDSRLLHYGERFATHLAGLQTTGMQTAGDWPWLADVARLDRLWSESHAAADAPVLAPARVAALHEHQLAAARLVPHPAARWHWCADWPAHGLWTAAREAWPDPNPPHWNGQGTLFTRPSGAVQVCELGPGACALLDACAAGALLPDAAEHALAAQPDLDLGATLALLLGQGACTEITP